MTQRTEKPPTPRRLYVLGDSVSIQYGPYLEQALGTAWRYARKSGEATAMQNLDIPVGANGGDSGMCARFLTALAEGSEATDHDAAAFNQADVLLMNCGLHDIKTDRTGKPRQVALDDYSHNLELMLAAARSPSRRIVWVRTTPVHEPHHNRGEGPWRFNADVDRYNDRADHVMSAHGVPIIDLHGYTLSLGPIEDITPDGRHFTPQTQRLQGGYLAGWLNGWAANP